MDDIRHYGTGAFGYKVVQKNGVVAFSWFKTKADRDSSLKDSKRKNTNTVSIEKVTR